MFVDEYPGVVSPELCGKIITMFEADPDQEPTKVIVDGVTKVKGFRTGTRLRPTSAVWQPVIQDLAPAFLSTMREYVTKHAGLQHLVNSEELTFLGPMIDRVQPGQSFDWHVDHSAALWDRVVAGLLYLNTIADGGSTEFLDQSMHVKPAAGKITLFPPYWTHMHRGVTPNSETKYLISFFWCYSSAHKK